MKQIELKDISTKIIDNTSKLPKLEENYLTRAILKILNICFINIFLMSVINFY